MDGKLKDHISLVNKVQIPSGDNLRAVVGAFEIEEKVPEKRRKAEVKLIRTVGLKAVDSATLMELGAKVIDRKYKTAEAKELRGIILAELEKRGYGEKAVREFARTSTNPDPIKSYLKEIVPIGVDPKFDKKQPAPLELINKIDWDSVTLGVLKEASQKSFVRVALAMITGVKKPETIARIAEMACEKGVGKQLIAAVKAAGNSSENAQKLLRATKVLERAGEATGRIQETLQRFVDDQRLPGKGDLLVLKEPSRRLDIRPLDENPDKWRKLKMLELPEESQSPFPKKIELKKIPKRTGPGKRVPPKLRR